MIEACNISHFYDHQEVLKSINIQVQKGEFLALTGASGSGKSTLLCVLSTLLKPTKGDLWFEGFSYDEIKDINSFRRKNIGFIFQFHYLISYLSILDNVLLGGGDSMYAQKLLQRLGILELANKLPHQVSGGQRQRAAIARALVNRPKVIFADEPTGNLDRKNSKNVFTLFKEISKEGTSVIVATHDLKLSKLCDRVLEIEDGII